MALRVIIILALLSLLAACGALPPIDSAPVDTDSDDDSTLQLPPRTAPPQPDSVPATATATAATAVDQLIDEAKVAMGQQLLGKASALVERALRLAPQDPRAYISLAQIRHQQGQSAQVPPLLQKAKALAGDDTVLTKAISQFEQSRLR